MGKNKGSSREKYTVELDTVKVQEVDKNPTLFAVVDTEKLGVIDLPNCPNG